jgi:hypothetical protein
MIVVRLSVYNQNKEDKMNFLSRTEELILLAVWRLKEKVYNVEIRRQLKKVTASYRSFGAVYIFFVLTIPFLVLQCGTGTVNNGSEKTGQEK